MPSYLHPGVYMEEVPSGARPIESAGTSTAAILGFATKGPETDPTLIFSWSEYKDVFGGFAKLKDDAIDYMGHTVKAFFDNGGSKAYISRVASGAKTAKGAMFFPGDITTPLPSIAFEATSPGAWGNSLLVSIEEIPNTDPSLDPSYDVTVFNQTDEERVILEQVNGLTLPSEDQSGIEAFRDQLSGVLEHIILKEAIHTTNDDNTPNLAAITADNYLPISAEEYADVWQSVPIPPANFPTGTETFNIKIDGASSVTAVTVTDATSIQELAFQIQKSVRDSGASDTFTCSVVAGDKLRISSGSNNENSAITIVQPVKFRNLTKIIGTIQETNATKTAKAVFSSIYKTISISGIHLANSKGEDGSPSQIATDYDPVFEKLRLRRDVNIILLPGNPYAGMSINVVQAAIAHATSMGNRMVIVDPPEGTELRSASDVAAFGPPTSEYTALYYPHLQVVNPHYHPEKNNVVPSSYHVPPSGFAAGTWARTDGTRGVWKAPGGLSANLFGVLRTQYEVGNDAQDGLNPEGVNCIRKILTDPVIWGARTLATRAVPEKRYVPVQRTTLMIKESIYQGIQWAVLEPNNHILWQALRLNVEAFMDGLFRAGAFQGEKASDAYFVRCGLGSTMSQAQIDAGQVIVEVGFAPLKPAEFVIVRISQKTAQS